LIILNAGSVPRYQALLNRIRSFAAEYGVNGFNLRIRAGFAFILIHH